MIEPAAREDVTEVMPLLLSAIGNIAYTLTGTNDDEMARAILADFFVQENNRISYKHVLVDRRDGCITGMLLSYAGNHAAELDRPFIDRLDELYGEGAAQELVAEARAGDFYLDSIAVDGRFQGQGIARALIEAFERRGREQGYAKLSLIVDPSNKRAAALYRRLGYVDDGIMMVSGTTYMRMIKLT